jgi:P27 family predicted phage terminase small subunit
LVLAQQIGDGTRLDAPRARCDWLPQSREAWRELWSAPVAAALARQHLPALYRLFEFRDLQARARRMAQKAPIVDGSRGQPVANPATGVAASLEMAIVALEDRIGLTPKAEARLGIALGRQQLTAADVNRLSDLPDGAA